MAESVTREAYLVKTLGLSARAERRFTHNQRLVSPIEQFWRFASARTGFQRVDEFNL
jgi:hypothetical protein